jgi:hypothetical protein
MASRIAIDLLHQATGSGTFTIRVRKVLDFLNSAKYGVTANWKITGAEATNKALRL